MKILFAIQGTGNGHLSRARDVYPELAKYGEVDVLISGIQVDVDFPFPVKYKLYGMSFIFGGKGGVDIWQTARKLKLFKLIYDIRKLPVQDYDLVINDFEPVSAWACKLKHKPCIGLSHQAAVMAQNAPQPAKGDMKGELILKHYAPVTAAYGFHFRRYAKNIFTPVIRREIRNMTPADKGHYTVYLPSYDDKTLVEHLSHFSKVEWQVFSKHNKEPFSFKNVHIQPIDNNAFIESMASSTGVLCGAGFEGPAEALFLGKKLMVIPMQAQYEQQCNAAAAAQIGVPVIKQLSRKYYDKIKWWLMSNERVKVDFPDETAKIIREMIHEHAPANMAVVNVA
ncbi:MAG: glycosyl transferase [Chitinophagaceae bacterium]|nr:glycosyl transferase [Chitinophagaceae bacterium]MCB9044701.1 glycosyl transferase [Chitinophagales bacterium]